MKSKPRILLSILSLTILSLACGLLATPAPPTEVQIPVVRFTEPPTQPPATISPPAGLVTVADQRLSVYNMDGVQLSQITLPQQTFLEQDRIHLAGKMPPHGESVPLLYFSYADGDALIFRDGTGQVFTLLNGASFLGLTGVTGQPVVAFSQVEYLDTNLRSKIYAGSIQTLPSAAPIRVIDDLESWAIKPVLVEAEEDTPTKVWYTRIAYGIGGDIVFEPRKGLFVLDVPSGQVDTILGNDVSPWAISEDQSWVAYAAVGTQENSMCLKNLQNGTKLCFPALPASEPRGVGNAFFSPDAQYIAWMEGDGSQMAEIPSFKATVRVGGSNGALIADLPMETFESAANIGRLGRAEPVAWLDAQTVLIQVRGADAWDNVALLRYDIQSQEITYVTSGAFVGLLYP